MTFDELLAIEFTLRLLESYNDLGAPEERRQSVTLINALATLKEMVRREHDDFA